MNGEMLTAGEVRDLIREEIADWGTQKAVAKMIGISMSYLSDVLLLRREPGPKIAEYFGLSPVVLYRVETPNTAPASSGIEGNENG